MSINWVMQNDTKGFVPLPKERILFTSPPRTTLSLQTSSSFPGKEPFSLSSPGGVAYVTNQRLVYLLTTPTPQFKSFSAPIMNLQDTHVSAPFFGPNVWTGILQPVTGGGIPPRHVYLEIKLTFKDGGAFDFHSNFERAKEALSNAIELARHSGHVAGAASGVDLSTVHLEQLPAYEEVGTETPAQAARVEPTAIFAPSPIRPSRTWENTTPSTNPPLTSQPVQNAGLQEHFEPPSEAPPGYEETQQSGVINSLEETLRRSRS